MRALLGRLGNPHERFAALHVAGTKGKGSTCTFAVAMCRAAGLKVGLTTSPHLSCARERIAIDGEMVGEEDFAALAQQVEEAAVHIGGEASFFEKMIAMAFVAFAEAKVDVAVVEVGLGGRLDATNVLVPRACAITRLGLDHTEHLGPTLLHIAREKAGILKPGVPAVTVVQAAEAARMLDAVANRVGAPLRVVRVDARLHPQMRGAHQVENASVAAMLVRSAGLGVSEAAVEQGARDALIPGRYETVRQRPLWIVDGAHNETAAQALLQTVQSDLRLRGRALHLVVGMTQGHDARAFAAALAALPVASVTAVQSRSPRTARSPDVARAFARSFGVVTESTLAHELVRPRPRKAAVLVTGSLYLVGEVRSLLLGVPTDPAFPLF